MGDKPQTVFVPAHHAVFVVPTCCGPDGCVCATVQVSNN